MAGSIASILKDLRFVAIHMMAAQEQSDWSDTIAEDYLGRFQWTILQAIILHKDVIQFNRFALKYLLQLEGAERNNTWSSLIAEVNTHFTHALVSRDIQQHRHISPVRSPTVPSGEQITIDSVCDGEGVYDYDGSATLEPRTATPDRAIQDITAASDSVEEKHDLLDHMLPEPTASPARQASLTQELPDVFATPRRPVSEHFNSSVAPVRAARHTIPQFFTQRSATSETDERWLTEVQRANDKRDQSDGDWEPDTENSIEDGFRYDDGLVKRKVPASAKKRVSALTIDISDDDRAGPSSKKLKTTKSPSKATLDGMVAEHRRVSVTPDHNWKDLFESAVLENHYSEYQKFLLADTLACLFSTTCDLRAVLSEARHLAERSSPDSKTLLELRNQRLFGLDVLIGDANKSLTFDEQRGGYYPNNEYHAMLDYITLAKAYNKMTAVKRSDLLRFVKPYLAPSSDDATATTRLKNLYRLGQQLLTIRRILGDGALVVLSGTKYRTLGKLGTKELENALMFIAAKTGNIFAPVSELISPTKDMPGRGAWLFNPETMSYAEFLAFKGAPSSA